MRELIFEKYNRYFRIITNSNLELLWFALTPFKCVGKLQKLYEPTSSVLAIAKNSYFFKIIFII